MKSTLQKSFNRLTAKFAAFAVGAACFAAVLSPSTTRAADGEAATQLKYLQLLVVLTGEAPWFPSGATARDYVQWARNNNMRPTGGWNPDAPITSDIIAQTLSQLLGYNPRRYNGDYYRTLAVQGINVPKLDVVGADWLIPFMDNPWEWTKNNPTSPKDPKDPKDGKNPRPKDPKDDKGRGLGHNKR